MTKSYFLSEEEIQVLDNLSLVLSLSTNPQISDCLYRGPAGELRYQAEKIEQKDYAIGMFKRLLSRIHASPENLADRQTYSSLEPTGRRGDPG